MEKIDIKEIKALKINDVSELCDYLNLDYVETTSQSNGYPFDIKKAIVKDTITELIELRIELEPVGFEVQEVILNKKDGWSLWYRQNTLIQKGQFKAPSDNEFYIDLDLDNKDFLPSIIADIFWGQSIKKEADYKLEMGVFYSMMEALDDLNKEIDSFIDELPDSGNVRVFYDFENKSVDYIVDEESTGFSYDSNYYKLGLIII